MVHGVKRALVSIAIAMLISACSDDQTPERRAPEGPSRHQEVEQDVDYEVIDTGDAGSIAGSVRWVGPPPESEVIPVRAHRDICGGEHDPRAIIVSPNGGVPDSVVFLVGVRRGAPIELPAEAPTITLRGCRFEPRVSALVIGASIVFRSADPVIHNVHAFLDGKSMWDFALPTLGSTETRTVEAPGVIRLLSDVHSFMQGWVHAFNHPYFAITDADGRFRISKVPPGQYVMHVWHEGWRIVDREAARPVYSRPIVLTRTLSVSQRQETTANFQLSRASAEIAGE